VSSNVELSGGAQLSIDEWRALAESLLDSLIVELCPERVLLGHFKASLDFGSGFIYANTTGEKPLVRSSGDLPGRSDRCRLKIALIAYELDPRVVGEKLEETLARVAQPWRIEASLNAHVDGCSLPTDAESPS
jgi:hypothetical protein